MTAQFGGVAARSVTRSPRSTLAGLMTSVGDAGLREAARRPALLADVDQHAAAVRDSLSGDHRPMTVATLAGYAQGVRDAAHEHGWQARRNPVEWSAPDWVQTRLLAVCALIRSVDAGH